MHLDYYHDGHPEDTYFSDVYEEYDIPEGMYPFGRSEVWIVKAMKSDRAMKRVQRRSKVKNLRLNTLTKPEAFRVERISEGTIRDKYNVMVRFLIARPEKLGESWHELEK